MTRPITALLAGIFSLCMLTGPVLAEDMTAAERAALQSRIDGFSRSFQTLDMDAVSAVIPPKVIAAMADNFDMEPAQLKAGMATALKQAMASVEITAYGMDMETMTTGTSSGGRTYALVPTATEMVVDGETRIIATSQTLAFADEGTWYLVRIDDAQQVKFLTLAYPEFKGIDFPKGTMKIVED